MKFILLITLWALQSAPPPPDFNKLSTASRKELPALLRQAEAFLAEHRDWPHHHVFVNLISRWWSRLGRYEDAKKLLDPLVQEGKDDSYTWAVLAEVHAAAGQEDLVAESWAKVIAKAPQTTAFLKEHGNHYLDWPSDKSIALIYERRGRWEKALASYEAWKESWKQTPSEGPVICGTTVLMAQFEYQCAVARCHFGMGQVNKALEEMWASGSWTRYLELCLKADRLADARGKADRLPKGSGREQFLALIEMAELFSAKDTEGLFRAAGRTARGSNIQDPLQFPGTLMGQLGSAAVDFLTPLIIRGDDQAIEIARFSGLKGLIKPLRQRRYSSVEHDLDRCGRLEQAIRWLEDQD
jgi:tetratricopeptide (TPR) repeat protein